MWQGRSLIRYSGFGELQAPLVPARWLPRPVTRVELDLSGRYTPSSLANEANFAPTGALKIDLRGGLSLRATLATSNRFSPDYFSHLITSASAVNGPAGPAAQEQVIDPARGNQVETIEASQAANTSLRPEAARTQSAGIVYERGGEHRIRASVDYVETDTSGEDVFLDAQQIVDLATLFPQRIVRASPAAGDPYGVGPVTAVYTGSFNAAWRHSGNWNVSFDYAWTRCLGGTLEAYCRWVYYQKYNLEVLPGTPVVDELDHPDGATQGLLRQRTNFGVSWKGRRLGYGFDGHYFHSRVIPAFDWQDQGGTTVPSYLQFDVFLQADLARLLSWSNPHYGLRAQARIDNVLGTAPPRFVDDPSGAGVQEYGDWRGRVLSLSVTATF